MRPKVKVTLRRGQLDGNYIVEKLVGATNVCDCFAGDCISEKGVNRLIDAWRTYEVTILAPKN